MPLEQNGVPQCTVDGAKLTYQKKDVDKFIWNDPSTNADKLPQTVDGIFNLFFDDDVIEMIVQETIRYAGSK